MPLQARDVPALITGKTNEFSRILPLRSRSVRAKLASLAGPIGRVRQTGNAAHAREVFARSALLSLPVLERLPGATHETQLARLAVSGARQLREQAEPPGVGVLANLWRQPSAHRQELEVSPRRVEDLVRSLRPTRRARDDVTCADRVSSIAEAELALAFDDEEHLFVDAVAVERKRALAWRKNGQVVAEFRCAQLSAGEPDARLIAVARLASSRNGQAVPPGLKLEGVDVEDARCHAPRVPRRGSQRLKKRDKRRTLGPVKKSWLERTSGILHPRAAAKNFRLTRHPPSKALAPFVAQYWIMRWALAKPYRQTVIPYPCVNLAVQRGQSGVFGVASQSVSRVLEGEGLVFGVQFLPGGFHAFFGKFIAGLTDRSIPIGDVFDETEHDMGGGDSLAG